MRGRRIANVFQDFRSTVIGPARRTWTGKTIARTIIIQINALRDNAHNEMHILCI